MPGDPKHVIYVWIDALMNYVTALGLGEPDSERYRAARHRYWPATYHVIGKEILWFHAVIWPAILHGARAAAARCVYAHSFWISEGQKMSKSLGNFVDLETIDRYVETLRPRHVAVLPRDTGAARRDRRGLLRGALPRDVHHAISSTRSATRAAA